MMDMTSKTTGRASARRRQAVIEQLWLIYFNDSLYAKGVITEEQQNKMRIRIKKRAQNAMK